MNTVIHQVFLIAGLCAIAAIVAVVLAFRPASGIRRICISGLALIFVASTIFVFLRLHPELFDARFRAFQGFYDDILVDMTRDEIDLLLERHYPKEGERQRPKIMEDSSGRLGFFMNPGSSSEPDCEGIFLTFKDGRVAEIKYLAD